MILWGELLATSVCLKTIVNPLSFQFLAQVTDSYPNIKTTSLGF
jgi:hypothetical protein